MCVLVVILVVILLVSVFTLKGLTYRFIIELSRRYDHDRPWNANALLCGVLLMIGLPFWMLFLMGMSVYLELSE